MPVAWRPIEVQTNQGLSVNPIDVLEEECDKCKSNWSSTDEWENESFELFLGNYNSPSDYWNNDYKFPLHL